MSATHFRLWPWLFNAPLSFFRCGFVPVGPHGAKIRLKENETALNAAYIIAREGEGIVVPFFGRGEKKEEMIIVRSMDDDRSRAEKVFHFYCTSDASN